MNRETLYRYYEGLVTDDEKSLIHQWIEADEKNRRQFITERIRFDATLMARENVMSSSSSSSTSLLQRLIPSSWVTGMIGIAASVALILGSLWMYNLFFHESNQPVYTQMVYVPVGSRTKLLLPDGTTVWLNSNTRLQYPVTFEKGKREIMLDGEAYLQVAKGETPFIVKTDKYDVQVLGTTFSVTAYAADSDFQTSLYEGRIKVYNDETSPLYLSPGETAYSKGNTLYLKNSADAEECRWTDGLICITDEEFPEIMKKFERVYNLRIEINDTLISRLRYNGKFRILDGVEHALKVLQNDYPFVYRRSADGDKIYIE